MGELSSSFVSSTTKVKLGAVSSDTASVKVTWPALISARVKVVLG